MGNYENLKQSITEVIRTNGNQEITGAVLQSTLLTIISTVGANATFAGIATPATNPGTPDGPVFYLASESGTYSNFGGAELKDGLSVLMWNGSWSSQQILSIDDEPTAGSDNLVKGSGVVKFVKNRIVKGIDVTADNVNTFIKELYLPIKSPYGDMPSVIYNNTTKRAIQIYKRVAEGQTTGAVLVYSYEALNNGAEYDGIEFISLVGNTISNYTTAYAVIDWSKAVSVNNFTSDASLLDERCYSLVLNPIINSYVNSENLDKVYNIDVNKIVKGTDANAEIIDSAVKELFFQSTYEYGYKLCVLSNNATSRLIYVYKSNQDGTEHGNRAYYYTQSQSEKYDGKELVSLTPDSTSDKNAYAVIDWSKVTSGINSYISADAFVTDKCYDINVNPSIHAYLNAIGVLENKNSIALINDSYYVEEFIGLDFNTDVLNGKNLNADGEVVDSAYGWKVKNYVDIDAYRGDDILLKFVINFHDLSGTNRPGVCFYDNEKVIIGSKIFADSGVKIDIPSNAKYVRFAFLPNYVTSAGFDSISPKTTQLDRRVTVLEDKKPRNRTNVIYDSIGGWKLSSLGTWVLSQAGSYTNTGDGNLFVSGVQCELSNRTYIFDVTPKSRGEIYVGAVGIELSSAIKLDTQNNKLAIMKYENYALTNQVLVEESFASSVVDRNVRIIANWNNAQLSVKLIDMTNGNVICQVNGTSTSTINPQCGWWYDIPAIKSNVEIELSRIAIYAPLITEEPTVWIAGDSITEGVGATTLADSWAKSIAGTIEGCYVSGRASGKIGGVIERVKNEVANILPQSAIVLIGRNGGNTYDGFTELLNQLKAVGTKLILATVPLANNETGVISMNETIIQFGKDNNIPVIRMDVATALNYNPANGRDTSLYNDGAHPNNAGYARMVEQVKITCPYLF